MLLVLMCMSNSLLAYYTTEGQNIIHRETGEVVQLRGIGLGGWLLPEGYMWGIRKLDRPRQFEAAIEELIGKRQARKFWDLYYQNFVTQEDVQVMKSWGVNTLRVPLLASMIQPREGQPAQAPYVYDDHNFEFLDHFVDWCEDAGMGIIWDLHGAPGGQNAENISDSDGTARLWTEPDTYWPMTVDLWDKITKRYVDYQCIVGYDLLNEPLLTRYDGVDPGLLRELYVLLTRTIRETDTQGIIFIEGDDWAQDFSVLEPIDWDPHLVLAFHSYPPSSHQTGIQRWDDLRQKYKVPLWHGETGEQNPPWELYKRSTHFMAKTNIGWNWWTHKKFDLSRQPWSIHTTSGFQKILDYWNGKGKRPSKRQAKKWLFEQAKMTNSLNCEFLPGMVESLYPLDPSQYVKAQGVRLPRIARQPRSQQVEDGYAARLQVKAFGYPLEYQWFYNGAPIDGATGFQLSLNDREPAKRAGVYYVIVSNEKGAVKSEPATISSRPFAGETLPILDVSPTIDGEVDEGWQSQHKFQIKKPVSGKLTSENDLGAWFSIGISDSSLFFLIQVTDDLISTQASVDYMRDGIEIYLDVDNSKSSFYGNDEYQLRYIVEDSVLVSSQGYSIKGASAAQQRLVDGYLMEISIPFTGLYAGRGPLEYLGIDVHINDSDGVSRDAKLAWWADRDNAYQSPAVFGTVKVDF